MSGRLPVVAVVGAPNVGKSTLVNRVLGRRQAVVAEEPGTTRDRTYTKSEWAGREFVLVDTGGMEPYGADGLQALVTLQSRIAAEEADVVIHLTDSRTGVTEADAVIARELRRMGSTVVLAVNKLDDPQNDADRYGFYSLGEGEPHPISALHGIGVGDLLDVVVGMLPELPDAEEPEHPQLAIVGRPNVGKSTLLNSLLGSERAVVSEVPGTTTDVVAGTLEVDGQTFSVLDTAGVTRNVRRARGVPYYSALRSAEAIRRSEVSLLLVDAVEGLVAGDLQIARQVQEAGRAFGVLVNKRDLVSQERIKEIERTLEVRMTDLKPPVRALSALEGSGLEGVYELALGLHRAYGLRVPTHEVAEFVRELTAKNPPPRRVKVRFALQTGERPPEFTLFATRPKDIPDSYVRYLENAFRESYGLWGVSFRIRLRSSR